MREQAEWLRRLRGELELVPGLGNGGAAHHDIEQGQPRAQRQRKRLVKVAVASGVEVFAAGMEPRQGDDRAVIGGFDALEPI